MEDKNSILNNPSLVKFKLANLFVDAGLAKLP